jgi:hypothetical protein
MDELIVVVASSKHPFFANTPRNLQSMATQENYPVRIVWEDKHFIEHDFITTPIEFVME